MSGVLMFHLGRMLRTGARSSASETSPHMQYWADYITGTHESSSWKRHVEQGLGISVVADFEFVAHPNLHALQIKDRIIRTEYSVAFHKDRAHSPLIKAFMNTIDQMKRQKPA